MLVQYVIYKKEYVKCYNAYHIFLYFYCNYQGKAKKIYRMLHLILRAASLFELSVGLHSVQSQTRGEGKICNWGNGGVDIVRDICQMNKTH